MIYILEGIHGGGKSTYAKSLNLPIHYQYLPTLPLIQQELSGKQNIVYDRMFSLAYINNNDEEIEALNTYLKSLSDVKCLMFICERELGWQRECDKHRDYVTREEYDRVYDGILNLISKMDVFEVIDTTNTYEDI